MFRVLTKVLMGLAGGTALLAVTTAAAQAVQHGRKYQPPPPTAHLVVTVEKGFNEKPLVNAAVIFHAVRNGKEDANLEVKTDPDGKATIDLLEIGSHVTMQVIANGYATHAEEFDLTADSKELLVKMERPKAQVSTYVDNDGKAANVKPGIQEHQTPAMGATGSTAAPVTPPPTQTPAVPKMQ